MKHLNQKLHSPCTHKINIPGLNSKIEVKKKVKKMNK